MSSAVTPTQSRRWPKWLPVVGWSLLGILGATLLVFIATVTFGAVHGTEFCPQTFERRSYSYYEVPLIRLQVTGERHEDLTGDTAKSLLADKHITPVTGGEVDWHVLAGSRGTSGRRPGDAGILMLYLDATEDGSNFRWKHWSEQHKEAAAVLWPAVQQLAMRNLYVFVPDLFDLAKRIDDAATLKEQVDRALAQKLLYLARKQLSRGNRDEARRTLDEAAALDPLNPELEQFRQRELALEKE
jgi:hypothetical protein